MQFVILQLQVLMETDEKKKRQHKQLTTANAQFSSSIYLWFKEVID